MCFSDSLRGSPGSLDIPVSIRLKVFLISESRYNMQEGRKWPIFIRCLRFKKLQFLLQIRQELNWKRWFAIISFFFQNNEYCNFVMIVQTRNSKKLKTCFLRRYEQLRFALQLNFPWRNTSKEPPPLDCVARAPERIPTQASAAPKKDSHISFNRARDGSLYLTPWPTDVSYISSKRAKQRIPM